MHNAKSIDGTGRKPQNQRGENYFNLLVRTKTGAMEEDYVVRWVQVCPVPEWHIRRSRQACEMMHTSCVVPATYKPGGVLRSDVGLMRLLRLKSCDAVYPWGMRPDNDLDALNDQVIPGMDDFFPAGFVKLCVTFVNTILPKLEELLDQLWKDASDLIKQWKRNRNRLVTLKIDRTYLHLLQ